MASHETSVNLGDFGTVNFTLKENFPPNSPFGTLLNKVGVQTTPPLARGYVTNSAIDLLNGNLAHICDFKFIFNFDIMGTLGLINPIEALQKAIRNAKLKAATRLRLLLQEVIAAFRKIADAITDAMAIDPSGTLSFYWSQGKDIVSKVNDVIQYIAEKVEMVLEWVFFAKMILELIQWIKSLPEKIRTLLATCLSNFTNSIVQLANTIKSIPEQISSLTASQIQFIADEFTAVATTTANTLKLSQESSNTPQVITDVLNSPTNSDAQLAAIDEYIKQNVPTQEEINGQKFPDISNKNSP